MLTSLHDRYLAFRDDTDSSYRARDLCSKILKAYPDTIKTHKESNKGGCILYHYSLTQAEAIRHAQMDENSVKQVAKYLHRQILTMASAAEGLPQNLSASVLNKGQGQSPPDLIHFFRILYTGSEERATDKMKRLISSAADDAVYATTRGQIKPGKHLTKGVALKSMTGSWKIVDILSRFGQCIGYHTVEAIETDLATDISLRDSVSPDGIQRMPGLCTALAWDNYDEFTNSLSGSGSLHDTVGICYQNNSTVGACGTNATESVTGQPWKRSKRSLVLKESNLEPYRKKPKISVFAFNERVVPRPINITTIEYRDFLWVMSLREHDAPMWVGWKSLVTEDHLPIQHIEYMENLALPSTRLDVITETLRISQQVARECGDEYAIVHYDLLMAKSAVQIQVTESPRFDDVFICFGPFHVEMAYFASLGFFLDGSGGLEWLTEAGVLAPGSLNGVLLGKHYNRYVQL